MKQKVHDLHFETDKMYRGTRSIELNESEQASYLAIVKQHTKGHEVSVDGKDIIVKAVPCATSIELSFKIGDMITNTIGAGDYLPQYGAGGFYYLP